MLDTLTTPSTGKESRAQPPSPLPSPPSLTSVLVHISATDSVDLGAHPVAAALPWSAPAGRLPPPAAAAAASAAPTTPTPAPLPPAGRPTPDAAPRAGGPLRWPPAAGPAGWPCAAPLPGGASASTPPWAPQPRGAHPASRPCRGTAPSRVTGTVGCASRVASWLRLEPCRVAGAASVSLGAAASAAAGASAAAADTGCCGGGCGWSCCCPPGETARA